MPEATQSLTAQPPTPPPAVAAPSRPVAVWEGELILSTYGWEQALIPTGPDDPVYPYPRLDFDAVTGPAPRTYRAVFLQNDCVELTVVPELGGRILRWVDRTTGRQLLYANPVIKPTRWGIRGWWLATGGIEWAFPTDEHGLNEFRPWQYELLGSGVRVWDVDDRSGLHVEVTILLDRERSFFTVAPRITNPTGDALPYQFWANAMLTVSEGNAPSGDVRFVLPADAVTVHSTSDGSLPGPGDAMGWPVHGGRDFSYYREWSRPTGVFARPVLGGYVGAYDPRIDQGIVRVFPATSVTGVKFFCLGDLGPGLWTDDASRYFELWGGVTPTFWDYWTLQPGASVLWTERWYAISGVGGFDWANEEAAIRLVPAGTGQSPGGEVAVATTRALDATVVVLQGGLEVARWQTTITPRRPFRSAIEPASGSPAEAGGWAVQVLAGGVVIAQMGP